MPPSSLDNGPRPLPPRGCQAPGDLRYPHRRSPPFLHRSSSGPAPSTVLGTQRRSGWLAPMLDAMQRAGTPTGPPLIVTRDPALTEQLLRLCAAAAVTPEVVSEARDARRGWARAACALVGDDLAGDVAAIGLPKRSEVVLVAAGPDSAATWQRGVALHADHVAMLPDAEGWLVDRLSDCLEASEAACLTVGIIGGCGGAGASTLAAALATVASRRRVRTMLVDADALSGGVELVLGCEDVEGLRWPQVASTHGRVSAAALRAALPTLGDLAVLSWDRGGEASLDATTMLSILSAGRRGFDLVVVDLPRRPDDAASAALTSCDVLLVVTTSGVRATAGAGRLLALLRTQCADIRLVVRSRAGADLGAETLSQMLHVPLLATIPTKRAVERSIEEGLGPPSRGQLHERCVSMLEQIGVGAAPR